MVLGFGLALFLVNACGGTSETPAGGSDAGGPNRARLPAPLHPDASCPVTIDTPPLLDGQHVPEGTPITYNSNPPSSGPHYPVWANFLEYPTPIPLPYLVHDLEHGAILLLYKCTENCAPVVEALRRVRDSLPTDPKCDPSLRVRVVIAPEPSLDVPVAASAWGWIYKAQCVDEPTLSAFAREHYGQGTEDFCTPGRTF